MTFRALSERLLSIAGTMVKPAPGGVDNAIDELLREGRVFDGLPLTRIPMDARRCSANIAQLWQKRALLAMCTGYALDGSGAVWRQHWWGLSAAGHIVETTERRSRYFGIDFTGEGADGVAAEILRKLGKVRSKES